MLLSTAVRTTFTWYQRFQVNCGGKIKFDEYNVTDTMMPVSSRILHLPVFGEFEYAVFSPQGDAIVWKFHRVNEEFWVSDKDGGHMNTNMFLDL